MYLHFLYLANLGYLRVRPSFPTRRSSDLRSIVPFRLENANEGHIGRSIVPFKLENTNEGNAGCPIVPFKSISEEHTSELQSLGHLVFRLLRVNKKVQSIVSTLMMIYMMNV